MHCNPCISNLFQYQLIELKIGYMLPSCRQEWPCYVRSSRVQVFRAAVQVHFQVHYFPLLFGRPPGRPTGLTATGLRPGLATRAPGPPPGLPTTPTGLRWGTGFPTERARRVTKTAKRRSSLMFVGLRRSEVTAKTGFFLSPTGTKC